MKSDHSRRISFSPRRAFLGSLILALGCTVVTCHREPTDADFFEPGVHAAGVRIAVDDSNAVRAKLGPPEYTRNLTTNGTIWMYPSKGLGIQFNGLQTVYHSVLETDSTVAQIMLLSERTIDSTRVTTCALRTRSGLTFESRPLDFTRILGEPPMVMLSLDKKLDNEYNGSMVYPGMIASFHEGRIAMIVLRYFPSTDTALLRRTIAQPITPAVSLGGVSMGMTRDQVRGILGETKFKSKRIQSEFWFYPQYAMKVQFGIPPIERTHSIEFLDTAVIGRVTGITGIGRSYFDGEVCSAAYGGRTSEGIGVGEPATILREKLGDPLHYATKDEAKAHAVSEFTPPGTPTGGTGMSGRYTLYLYPGIAFFVEQATNVIHHIEVTNEKYPLDEAQ